MIALVGVVFRMEAVFRGQIRLGAVEWLVLPLPEIGLAGVLAAIWLTVWPRGVMGGRVWRLSFIGTMALLLVLTVMGQQFLTHTGTPLHREIVTHALGRLDELGGLLASGFDPGIVPRLGLIVALVVLGHRVAPLRGVDSTTPVLRPVLLGLFAAALSAAMVRVAVPYPSGAPLSLTPLTSGAGRAGHVLSGPEIPYAMPKVTAPAPEGAPNIVVVVLESTRADVVHPYGPAEAKQVTPNLSRLAEGGVVVQHAYGTTTHTTKALVGLFCGMHPHPAMELVETVPGGIPFPCLPDLLGAGGYRTAFMQSAAGAFEDRRVLTANMGFQTIVAQEDIQTDAFEAVGYVAMDERVMLEPALAYMEAGPQPFFLAMLTSVPHHPYHTPGHPAPTVQGDPRTHYLGTVHHVDAFVGTLTEQMAAKGLLDDTILVFVGDHGEAFGEHGAKQHDAVPYDEVSRTPLMLYGKGRLETQTVEGIRSHLDVMPTLLGLSGLGWEGLLPGRDLFSTPGHESLVTSCWYDDRCAAFHAGNLAYAYHFGRQSLEVFDTDEDPDQLENLASVYPAETLHRIQERIVGVRAAARALWEQTPAKVPTRPVPAPSKAAPARRRANCMRACVADTDPNAPGLQVQCQIAEVDREGVRHEVPRCGEDERPPTGSTVCWLPRVDDRLAEECRRQRFNLELLFPRSAPPPKGAVMDVSCRLSDRPEVDCGRP